MNGILLGSCKTEANRIECLVETDGMDMGGSGIPLEKMGGMILLTESGGFFGTEWDDQPIRPENFREWKRSEPVLENYTPGSGPFSKKTMRPSQQPFFAIRILQFRTSPSVPQIKWPVHTWCTRKLRPAGTVYGRHVRLFLLQRKQLYQGEKRQGRVLVPCD